MMRFFNQPAIAKALEKWTLLTNTLLAIALMPSHN
jgi:hypothetical protein